MNPLLVSARGLCHRAMQAEDQLIEDVSLLPCFEASGRVTQVVLVRRSPSMICLLEWRPGLLRVPLLGPVTLRRPAASLRPINSDQMEFRGMLWSNDMAGVLGTMAPGRGDNLLRVANGAPLMGGVKMLFFRRDLSRICQYGTRVEVKRWDPKLFPATMPVRRSAVIAQPRRLVWRLAPIWKA
jgi:hypothetical protein